VVRAVLTQLFLLAAVEVEQVLPALLEQLAAELEEMERHRQLVVLL
jgi:sirohydrochlorin ferrochelatase